MNEPIFDLRNEGKNLSAALLEARKVLVFGEVDENVSCEIIAKLMYLAELSADPIELYINTVGGKETEILAIYDVMQNLRCEIKTVCVGKAHGLSALLLAGGTKGKRYAYANAEIMLNQVGRDRTFGQASDIELETEHLLRTKQRVNKLLASLCGGTEDDVAADLERKYWLFAEEAKEYGLIDDII